MDSEREIWARLVKYVDGIPAWQPIVDRFTRPKYGVRSIMNSQRIWRRVMNDGYLVPVYVISSGGSFVSSRTDIPCLVLLTYDREKKYDRLFMTGIVRSLLELKELKLANPAFEEALKIINPDTRFWLNTGRKELPKSLTGGVSVYVVHTILQRHFLKRHEVDPDEELLCVTWRGRESQGFLAHIPWWVVEGAPEEKRDLSTGLDWRIVGLGLFIIFALFAALYIASVAP